MTSVSTSDPALTTPFPNRPSRSKASILRFLPLAYLWESISMDYVSGLPSTMHGNDYVVVVVDRFSKMAIMATCKKNITAEATTKLFFESVGTLWYPTIYNLKPGQQVP